MVKLKKTNSGFTLIELMIVIAMIGILSAVVVPRINSWLPAYRLKSAASDLQSNMQKARVQAIKTNIPVQIRIDNTNPPGFYYFDTFTPDDDVYTAGEFRVDFSSYGSGVAIGTGSAVTNWSGGALTQATAISFGTSGTSNPATIYLQNNNGTICYAITTNTAGTSKVRMYNGTNWN